MTWNKLPPNDWDSESDSPEESERLNQIERRLKAARPTPVHLDAAALERIIAASDAPAKWEPETATPGKPAKPVRRRWLGRAAGAIAAIWLCGVVVGSSIMFLIMNREPEIARADNPQPPVALAPQEHASQELEQQNIASSPASPELDLLPIDRNRANTSHRDTLTVYSTAWLDAPAFGWEEPLRPFGHRLRKTPISAVSLSGSRTSAAPLDQAPLQQSDAQRQLASSFVPPPKATPQRILEELMADGMTFGQPL